MSKTKILITGATGSLGAALVRYYSRKGYHVIAHGRMHHPPPNLLKFAQYVSFDLNADFELPECDVCIHTAALSDDKAELIDLRPANVDGTKRLLEKLPKHVQFIHISSSSVYLPDDKPIPEEMAGKQNNQELSPYGLSKLETEYAIMEVAKQDSVYILRPRAFYGAGDCMILPRILKLVKHQAYIQRPGTMQVNVSLTHYETISKATEACIDQRKNGIHIFNISDENQYLLIDVVRAMTCPIYGKSLAEKQVPIAMLKVMSWFKIGGITKLLVRSFTKNMVLDTTKAKHDLNFSHQPNFDQAMKELAAWVHANGGVEQIGRRDLAWSTDLCE